MMKEAKTLRFKLREWMELTEIYRKLKNKDPSANYGEFTDAEGQPGLLALSSLGG